MTLNIPNILSLSRVVLIPPTIYLYLAGMTGWAFGLLLFSVISDFLDGKLARWLDQETEFGALLDPIADKLISLSYYSLVLILGLAPWPLIAIVLARNFSQLMSVPILIWWLKKEFKVRPSQFAKWATALSDLLVFVPLFFSDWLMHPAGLAGMVLVGAFELKILVGYVPRLIAIATDRHDTFE